MADLPPHRFEGRDGVDLAYRVVGRGRPVAFFEAYRTPTPRGRSDP